MSQVKKAARKKKRSYQYVKPRAKRVVGATVIGRTKIKIAYRSALPQGVKISVDGVRLKLGISQGEFARITGYSVRSIAGWESGKPLSESALQKMNETERLRSALSEIIPAQQVGEWLRTPNPAFEGQTPIQVIERGESDRIWRMIFQIDAGVAS